MLLSADCCTLCSAADKLHRRLLQGLLSSYPTDFRSLPPAVWNCPKVRQQHWKHWGWVHSTCCDDGRATALDVQWHVASPAEVDAATELISGAIGRAEALLEGLKQSMPVAPDGDAEMAEADGGRAAGGGKASGLDLQVRCTLLELRALAKGALPYIDDTTCEGGGASSPPGGASAHFQHMEMPEDVHLGDADSQADGDGGTGTAAQAEVAPGGSGVPGLPRLRGLVAAAGKVGVDTTLVGRLMSTSTQLGKLLAAAENVKNTLQLLRVVRVLVSDRTSSTLSMRDSLVKYSSSASRISLGERKRDATRATLVHKAFLRHEHRINSTSFGAAVRCPQLLPLISLQLELSLHHYSKVRRAAQSGFVSSLRHHPWLGRRYLRGVIDLLPDPKAEAHRCKGATFLLQSGSVLKRVTQDWSLLGQLLLALCNAHDHGRPKDQMRLRALFASTIENCGPPPIHFDFVPLAADGVGGVVRLPPGADAIRQALVGFYDRIRARQVEARSSSFALLLTFFSTPDAQTPSAPAPPTPQPVTSTKPEPPAVADPTAAAAAAAAIAADATADPAAATAAAQQLGAAMSSLLASSGAAKAASNNGGAQHWSRELCALCSLSMLPQSSGGERHALAACVAQGLCSASAPLRRVCRAVLSILLVRERTVEHTLAPTPPPLTSWDDMPSTDAEWDACKLSDQTAAGWAVPQHYPVEKPPDAGAAGAAALGAEADRLLTDPSFMTRVLQWLVADHQEADSSGGNASLAQLMAQAKQPEDAICYSLRGGTPYPWPASYSMQGKNFTVERAQLFKGIAAHYGRAHLMPILLPELTKMCADSKRDSQAAAAEVIAGLVRGSGMWTLSAQTALWEELAPLLRNTLRACPAESVGDWQSCMRFCSFNRDPRRIRWLAQMLLQAAESACARAVDATASLETSLAQANNLRFLAPLVTACTPSNHIAPQPAPARPSLHQSHPTLPPALLPGIPRHRCQHRSHRTHLHMKLHPHARAHLRDTSAISSLWVNHARATPTPKPCQQP